MVTDVDVAAVVEPGRVRRSEHASRPRRPHLAAGHRPLQQVSCS